MDIKKLQELIDCVSKSTLTYFEFEENGSKIVMKKELERVEVKDVHKIEKSTAHQRVEGVEETEVNEDKKTEFKDDFIIKSPMVGTFYASPSPDAKPFVEVGQRVKKGEILCIIEAMKIMNEIESDVDGVVLAVCAKNGEMVEYGQALFRIQKDGE